MRSSLVICLALSGLMSGCTQPTESLGHTEWGIVDGERTDMNEQAVVAVLNRRGGLCTGTLISPRVVLTAKHCIQSSGATGPTAASNMVIGIGDRVRGLTETYNAIDIRTTPGPYRDDGSLSGLVGIDVALITLQTESTIEPIPVHRGNAANLVGEMARAVGFGEIPEGGAGVKYRRLTQVTELRGGVIGTPPTICQGDSGGPLITLDGEVFGVASFGTGACGGGFNGYNRIDTFMEMIDEVLEESGACTNTGVEDCDGRDDDCDDLVDEGCLDTGVTCTAGEECLSLRCEETGAGSICTEACNPRQPETGCPPGLYCASTDGCDGRCELGSAGTFANDADCTDDTDCLSLFCDDPGDGRRRCLTPCENDAGGCFFGEACAANPGQCGGCVPDSLLSAPGRLGEACVEDTDCGSDRCLVEAGDSYCTRDCADDSDCGDAFHCRITADESICARGPRSAVGDGCIRNEDCAPGLFCATRGTERWCTNVCNSEEDCPDRFDCVPVGEVSVCVGQLGTAGATCASDMDCLSSTCRPVGPEDALVCTRECDIDSPCASGFACVRDDSGTGATCAPLSDPPVEGGGCSVGSGSAPFSQTFALLVIGALAFRRRRP